MVYSTEKFSAIKFSPFINARNVLVSQFSADIFRNVTTKSLKIKQNWTIKTSLERRHSWQLKIENSTGMKEPVAVIIVDHGSRRQASNILLESFVEVFKSQTGREFVEFAHMELAEPSIGDAFSTCVKKGAKTIIVTPYFLSPGRHWEQDIPALSAAAAKNHPGISFLVTAPIGVHPLVAQVLDERIKQCVDHALNNEPECDICKNSGKCKLETI